MAFLQHLPELWSSFRGSKPTGVPQPHRPNGKIVKDVLAETPIPTIPHSDAPHRRKMIVLQEYSPQDNRGLPIRRGESVLVINQEGDWLFVRNERSKEGYVPRTHLVAPYSSTRTRQGSRSGSGNPIRAVNSNSSIHDIIDHSPSPSQAGGRPIPMYTTQSTDRPRRFPADHRGGLDARDNRVAHMRRVVSPPTPVQTILPSLPVDLSNNNNNVVVGMTAVNGHSSYEQKHSPSSSSGVASLNGPSSPSFTSLQNSTSQEIAPHAGSGTSQNDEDRSHSSLSSMDEAERQSPRKVLSPVNTVGGPGGEGGRGWMTQNAPPPHPYQETSTRIRATSESNLSSLKHRPLPTPPRRETGRGGTSIAKRTPHIYSTITDEEPPPIPPRTIITPSAAKQRTAPLPPLENGEGEEYSNPADALHGQERPSFNYPRVRSLTDVRARDTRLQHHQHHHQHQPQDAQYSAVFQGGGIPPHKRGGAGINRMRTHSETESEGGSGSQPSHRSSSTKHSGSRVRIEEERSTPEGPPLEKAPRLPGSGHEEQQAGRDRRERRRDQLRAQTRIGKFRKCLWGLYVVIENFEGMDENEVTVKKGEHVSVWNQDDREWYWIVKHTSNYSEEGFIPSIALREIVSSDPKHAPPESVHQNGHGGGSNGGSPSLKQQLHSHLKPESSARHRQRSGSQELRSRRPSSGGSQGRRGRINSDSSSRSASAKVARTPSISSIEKADIPESPPSSSPPPPYSEHDSGNTVRRFSLSQQQDSSTSNGYGVSMHRTRSHGHVHHIRGRGNIQSLSQPSGEPGGLVMRRDQAGGMGSRSMMTAANSGTLV